MGPGELMYRRIDESVVRDVLQRWQAGEGLRTIARATSVDRKTVRRYVRVAQAIRLEHSALDHETLLAIVAVVRQPAPTVTELQHALACKRTEIRASLASRVTLATIHERLVQSGVDVSYATLRRFAIEECGWHTRRAVAA